MDITVERSAELNTLTLHVPEHRSGSEVDTALAAALAEAGVTRDATDSPDLAVELWINAVDDVADAAATEHGFVAYRELWQLRCPLPAEPSGLVTRAFTDADIEAFLGVNNRAFSWHPEQGGMTEDDVRSRMREPWFNADGFRLLERDDTLIGFCWTKVHHDHDPVLGEIYVIAVDPSVHGQGLGGPMTRAGLDWLAEQGLEHAMLYVESDNHAANATYERIGFAKHLANRAYRLGGASA